MEKKGQVLKLVEPDHLIFWCPGCRLHHGVRVGEGATWKWNGDMEKPSFSPSILVRQGHYVPGHKGPGCWCTYNEEHPDSPAPYKCGVCHSFVRDGQIQFLNDCTHELVGKTVPLPFIPL